MSVCHCLLYHTSGPDCEAGWNCRPSFGVLPAEYASLGTERETPRGPAPTFHSYDPLRQNTENKGRGQSQQAKVWTVKKKLGKEKKRKVKHKQVPEANSQKFFKVVENSKEDDPRVQQRVSCRAMTCREES